ncbi:TetR/AcrR family transcriptional regulator [Lacihabitans sp. LS3-19]|uniref:TetR/AcrR family transcriptional regulator n=1 Tax=Lacihabitans sp. LS3-19 TaxID=2487335 RepID=UPI0020CBBD09|nr:TetR/AcrR family transcriptional regulator [Lacihabitans sp. LS3-19]MCP9770875.1 TetR/AcrR family transcriptional regulator [Lacihabitans sp. LS3-19]
MSPISSVEFEKKRAVSRKKIIDTALMLFGSNGFANTSISQIAKEAGISKGLMYNYFESKDDLLEKVILETVESMQGFYLEFLEEADARKMLLKMIDFTVEFLKTEKEFNVLLTSLGLQKESHPIIKKIASEKINQLMPLFLTKMNDAGIPDAENEIYIMGAVMDGLAVQYLTTEDEVHLMRVANALKKRYNLGNL